MRNKRANVLIVILLILTLISGCNKSQDNTQSPANENTPSEEPLTTVNLSSSQVIVDTEFSASDLEVGYEDSTATKITLKDLSIEVTGEGASVKDSVVTITEEGTYVITGNLTDGQIVIDADERDKIRLILDGVSIHCSNQAPIYIKQADKVFITLNEGTENNLTDGNEYTQSDDNTVDGVIFSKADLTINGKGKLNITANYKHGIVSKDELVITGGTYYITAVKDAINGKDCVKIKEGDFTLETATGNGIQSKNSDDATKGFVYIAGGNILVTNSNEGIEGTVILIEDGKIDITAQDDGLNAASGSSSTTNSMLPNQDTEDKIQRFNESSQTEADVQSEATVMQDQNGGTPQDMPNRSEEQRPSGIPNQSEGQNSGDRPDPSGQNLGNGQPGRGGFGQGMMENDSDCLITIKGGTIRINALGDGIDSNGSIIITGGTVNVCGSIENNNSALDYDGIAQISGGIITAAGSSGMAQGFRDSSTQYSLLYNFSSTLSGGTKVSLTDQNGNEVISFTPEKQFQSVVISTPELSKDTVYTIKSGDLSEEITLSAIATSAGVQSNGMGFGGRGGQGQNSNE